MLEHLSRDIEGEIRRVYDTSDEIEVLREQILALVHDQDARAVQLQASGELIRVVLVRHQLRNEHQSIIADHSLDRDRDGFQRRCVILECGLVESLILFLCNVCALSLPQRHHRVEHFIFEDLFKFRILRIGAFLDLRMRHQHLDREADVVGVLLHEFVYRVLSHVLAVLVLLLAVLSDVHDDVGSMPVSLSLFDRISAGTFGHPSVSLVFTVLLSNDFDCVGYHERRVETYAELSYDVHLVGKACRT